MSDFKKNLNTSIRQLIIAITNFQEDSEEFKQMEVKLMPFSQNFNTLYNPKKLDIDRIIESLGEKFAFHGYIRQKKRLLSLYKKLIPEGDLNQELLTRLSVVKLLIELANSPTNNVTEDSQVYPEESEETIDWGSYLLEGVERWTPPPEESSESDEEFLEKSQDKTSEQAIAAESATVVAPFNSKESASATAAKNKTITLEEIRSHLRKNVQSSWFNSKKFYMKPASDTPTANFTLLWHNHLENVSKGLIPIEIPSIIDEYLVLREIIWQMFTRHSGACFCYDRDQLIPVPNVTISSVRLPAFQSLLNEFILYMDYFYALREFSHSLLLDQEYKIPDTYRGYNYAVEMITKPMFERLMEIEQIISKQDTIYTLLTLAKDLQPMREPLKWLYNIQKHVILDFKSNSSVLCATTLLTHLHKCLFTTVSKAQQDVYLTLYLQSLCKYMGIINSWLSSGDLEDQTWEFVIVDTNRHNADVLYVSKPLCSSTKAEDWQMGLLVKDLDQTVKQDPILNLICTKVFQIGQNIRLLAHLGKIQQFFDFIINYKENFYEAFINKVLEKMANFFDVPLEESFLAEEEAQEESEPEFVFPSLCPDDCKYFTEMDKLENLVDTSNVFLMKAFENYFVKKVDKTEPPKQTLYEKIQKLCKTLFPVHNIIADVFVEILEERYSRLGLMVKNILVHDHDLEKHFVLLQQIFLFKDDLIFPFYRRIFEGMESKTLGNHVWLTSFLQDAIVDVYPNFYRNISVELNNNWRLADDILKAYQMINMKYRLEWPVNIIIRTDHIQMYRELFQFILRIKWALYTLNHLYFSELEPKDKAVKITKAFERTLAKLKILRFGLLNIFSIIQHYILGHIFFKFSDLFSKELENAYDLETLIDAHINFVFAMYKACSDFQEYEQSGNGFVLLLHLVAKIRFLWRNVEDVAYDDLNKYVKSYWMCHKKLEEFINTSIATYDL